MVNRDKLWITGGMAYLLSDILTSTEFIQYVDGHGLSSLPGPNLPIALTKHQIVSFNSNFGYVSMVIGGEQLSEMDASKLTYFFLHENQTWIEGPDLTQGRVNHAATVVTDPVTKEELVIVTGGQVDATSITDEFLDTTEILVDGKWVSGNL